MVYSLELGFQKDPYNPLRDINKVIQGLKEEKDADRYILLIDEVLPTKENETCDKLYLSYLDLSCSHIDLLLALNPRSLPFKNLKNGQGDQIYTTMKIIMNFK